MASTYILKSTTDQDGLVDATLSLAKTIFEQDDEPINTGLIDKYGSRIFRRPTKQPIGFFTALTTKEE